MNLQNSNCDRTTKIQIKMIERCNYCGFFYIINIFNVILNKFIGEMLKVKDCRDVIHRAKQRKMVRMLFRRDEYL